VVNMGYLTLSSMSKDVQIELFGAVVSGDINKALRILGELLDDEIRRIGQ